MIIDFNTNIALDHFKVTKDILQQVVAEAMSKGADYADLFFEHTNKNQLVLQDGEVNRTASSIDYGVGIRAVVGDQTGYAYVENTNLKEMLLAARTAANIASQPKTQSPIKIEEQTYKNFYPTQHPWIDTTIASKKHFLQKLNSRIFELDKRMTKVSITLVDSTSQILFFNSLGVLSSDYQPMSLMYARCTMEEDGKIESGSSSRAYRMGFDFLTDELMEALAQEAVLQTTRLFGAIKPKAGEMPVVMAAGESGILLHEAIGHAFEADFNRKGMSIFSDQLGKKICHSNVNVVDDGTLSQARGSINMDDEGVESKKTHIVKDGILESYLHDRISAKHYGVSPTGNGRRESFRYMPLPRMRVTYMENGNMDEKDIISSVKQGIYVDDFTNGQVQIGAGDFTFFVKTGYLIENGKLTQPIKDINIIGNGPKALADISMIANNIKIENGAGTCGKDGQSIPVGYGMPTVLVNKLTVGGE